MSRYEDGYQDGYNDASSSGYYGGPTNKYELVGDLAQVVVMFGGIIAALKWEDILKFILKRRM